MDEEPPDELELDPLAPLVPERVEVARSLRRHRAEERALVVLAMGLPYWIIRDEGRYSLLVRAGDAEAVRRELALYEMERQSSGQPQAPQPLRQRVPPFSLFVFGWLMGVFFLLQLYPPVANWQELGAAQSAAILHGEWWRVFTALTLHADLGHLIANLVVGIIFAAGLLPWLGSGWTWLGILMSGGLGNALNAWGYRGDLHTSIGASTAVFGALGMLVGWQLAHPAASAHLRTDRVKKIILPIAAGLALLAYLGTGSEGSRVDFMAHLFGMLSGTLIGLLLGWSRLPERTSLPMQRMIALFTILLLIAAWMLALF